MKNCIRIPALLLSLLLIQSCSSKVDSITENQVRIEGRILDEFTEDPIKNAIFTLTDHSTDPNGGILYSPDKIKAETNRKGEFDLIYTLKNSTDLLNYDLEHNTAINLEQKLSISAGETIDLGDIYITETVLIDYDASSLGFTEGTINLSVATAFDFKIIDYTAILENGIIENYIFPNQINKIILSQTSLSGIYKFTSMEVNVGDIRKGATIVLNE